MDVTIILHTAGTELRENPSGRELFITISTESADGQPLPDVTFNLRKSNNTEPFIAGQDDSIDIGIPHDFDKVQELPTSFFSISPAHQPGYGNLVKSKNSRYRGLEPATITFERKRPNHSATRTI